MAEEQDTAGDEASTRLLKGQMLRRGQYGKIGQTKVGSPDGFVVVNVVITF